MKFTKHSLAAWAFIAPILVTSSPVSEPAPDVIKILQTIECIAVDAAIEALTAYSSATPFCSSFLGIPTITSITTSTVSAPTTTTVPTITGANTVIPPVVTSSTTTITTVSSCVPQEKKKRNAVNTPPPAQASACVPSALAKFASAELSQACSSLDIATPTTTSTSVVTVTPTVTALTSVAATVTATPSTTVVTVVSTYTDTTCPTPTACSNQGLQWAYYDNISGNNEDNTYSNFVPEVYKTQPALYTGVTSSIGGIDESGSGDESIYGSPPLSSTYFVLNHRGYIFAQQSGTYTFDISSVDDTVYLWIGSDAYSGWTAADSNIEVSYAVTASPKHAGSGSYSIDLVQGQYYPVRIIFAQAQGGAVFEITVTAPDGEVFLSSSTTGSPYLVQYSCDLVTAPPYAEPFGSET